MKAVQTTAGLHGVVHQRHVDRANIVVDLPSSPQEYTASIHASTRSTIRNYLNKIRRDHPSFQVRTVEGNSIEESAVAQLVQFNQARMQAVGKRSYNSVGMQRAYVQLAHACPTLIVTVWIEGQLCAGSLNYRSGDAYYGFVNAFDARYGKYSLGTLCAYLTMCEAIQRGAKRFHLGWDRVDYKFRLRGVAEPSWRFEVYRSRLHQVAAGHHAVGAVLGDRMRRFKLWAQDPARRNTRLVRFAIVATNSVRSFVYDRRGGPLG
jgi:CelD/BcsL family acetyltransferase involved in cellulose biosynthesis